MASPKILAGLCWICALIFAGCATFDRVDYVKTHTLDHFMVDRPRVAALLRKYPDCEQWLRSEWSEPIGNFQLVWQNQAPDHGSMANNVPFHEAHLIGIHISPKLNAWDQLICLSFETLNARGLPRFDALMARATVGAVSRADFIDGIEAVEYDAVIRAQECIPRCCLRRRMASRFITSPC